MIDCMTWWKTESDMKPNRSSTSRAQLVVCGCANEKEMVKVVRLSTERCSRWPPSNVASSDYTTGQTDISSSVGETSSSPASHVQHSEEIDLRSQRSASDLHPTSGLKRLSATQSPKRLRASAGCGTSSERWKYVLRNGRRMSINLSEVHFDRREQQVSSANSKLRRTEKKNYKTAPVSKPAADLKGVNHMILSGRSD